jgi:hypothetical protein
MAGTPREAVAGTPFQADSNVNTLFVSMRLIPLEISVQFDVTEASVGVV